jgi:opacity protein-like surface antigen
MTSTKTLLLAILAVALLSSALAAEDKPVATPSGFNGAWTLDVARSDDKADQSTCHSTG